MAALLPALTTALIALASQGGDSLSLEDIEALAARQEGSVASQFVKISRSDEFFFNSFDKLERKMHAEGTITDSQLACLGGLKIGEYNQILSVALALEYDDATLQQVLQFYSSPVGARFMRMVYEKHWRQTPDDFPLPPEHAKEFITLREFRELAAFRDSGVPLAFLDPRMVMQWDDARKMAATLWRVKTVQCGVPDESVDKAFSRPRPTAGGGP